MNEVKQLVKKAVDDNRFQDYQSAWNKLEIKIKVLKPMGSGANRLAVGETAILTAYSAYLAVRRGEAEIYDKWQTIKNIVK